MKEPEKMSAIELAELSRVLTDLEQMVEENKRFSNMLIGRDYNAICILKGELMAAIKKLFSRVSYDNYVFEEKDVLDLVYCSSLHRVISGFDETKNADDVLKHLKVLKDRVRENLMQKMHIEFDALIGDLTK